MTRNNITQLDDYRNIKELSESIEYLNEEKESTLMHSIELLVQAKEDITGDPDFDPSDSTNIALLSTLAKLMKRAVEVNTRFDRVIAGMDNELNYMQGNA